MNTMEWWIERARTLRRGADKAEREFIEHLRAFEATRLWQTQAPTFDRLIEDFDICKASRFRNGCRALDAIKPKTVASIGMHAAIAVMRCEGDDRVSALKEMTLTAQKNGVPLSAQNANRIVARYSPPESKVLATESTISKLRGEITALRKENAQLRKRLAKYEPPEASASVSG